MASVSSAERERRERVRLRASLTSQGATSGVVTRRKPPPTSMICSARPCPSSRAASACTSSRASRGEGRSSTSWMRSGSTGVSEAKSRASTTSMGSGIRAVSGSRLVARGGRRGAGGGAGFDDHVAEELRLVHAGLAQPYQLEKGQERHHPLRPHALGARHGGEEDGPGVPQELEDLAHALEHGERVRLDLSGRLALLLLDEPGHRATEEMHGEILERHVLGRRQLGHGASIEERLLRFALAQPRPECLDAGVLPEPLGQLLPQQFPFLVESFGWRVGIHGEEQLGLEIDQRGGHHHERAGRLQILELHGLEVGQVLLRHGADGQVGEIDLVGAAEMQEQIERADEGFDADREAGGVGLGRDRGSAHGSRFTTARTSAMVVCANARAFFEPSWSTSTMSRGLAAKCSRRSRISASGGSMCFRSTPLQSRHPMPAVRHPVALASRSAAGVKILWRSKTGQRAGLPGSVRRLRAGSVTMGFTFAVISSEVSERRIAFPSDFDILRPSVPGTFGISVSLAPGSGKMGFQVWLNRRATSRVSSTCGTWSMPTGTHWGLYMRMSAAWSSG